MSNCARSSFLNVNISEALSNGCSVCSPPTLIVREPTVFLLGAAPVTVGVSARGGTTILLLE